MGFFQLPSHQLLNNVWSELINYQAKHVLLVPHCHQKQQLSFKPFYDFYIFQQFIRLYMLEFENNPF